jgi:alpha-galactosidase/6-phospho-beta-glucosidase family protein
VPDATFINYSNLMTAITGPFANGRADVIRLCISTHHVYHQLTSFIGKPAVRWATWQRASITHLAL